MTEQEKLQHHRNIMGGIRAQLKAGILPVAEKQPPRESKSTYGSIDPNDLLGTIIGSGFIPTSPPFTPPKEGEATFVRRYRNGAFSARLVIYYRGSQDYDMVALLLGGGIRPVRVKLCAKDTETKTIWLKEPSTDDIVLLKLSLF